MSDQQPEKLQTKQFHHHQILQNVGEFYLNEKIADVHFLFGLSGSSKSTLRVPSHKFLLAAESDVFEAMFYGELKEKGDVHVEDASRDAFQEFLQYFYLNDVTLTAQHIFEVLHLGHKYNVKKCLDDCLVFLMDVIDEENVCTGLHCGMLYEQIGLLNICEKRILVDTAAVLKSASFLEGDKKVLGHILKMDLLSCSEAELFEACMSWVKAKSGQETVSKEAVEMHLGDLYYQIRFASMTMEQLCNLGAKYDAVLQSDFIAITSIVTIPTYQSKHFNLTPRKIKWKADAVIECSFRNGTDYAYQLPKHKSIIFSTNEPLLLGGFKCGKIVRVQDETGKLLDLRSALLVDVVVIETTEWNGTNGNDLLKMKAHLRSADTKVMLSRPVLVRPGFFYKILLGPFPDDHGYHSELLKTEKQIQSNITIKLNKCSTADTPQNVVTHEKPIGIICALDFNNIQIEK